MGLYDYSLKADEREVARAQAHDLDASYKELSQVFGALRGHSVSEARKVLEDCIAKKKPIEFKKFNKGMGHRPQLGGKKGRFPVKEAKIALNLLKNAEANANYKGLSVEELVVKQAAAYKQNVIRRYRHTWASSAVLGYGKQAMWANYVTCWAELVLGKGKGKHAKKKEFKEKRAKHKKEHAERKEHAQAENAKQEGVKQ